ncbi:hypothetical protein B0H13DRAFT_1852122 [Mycena leptocephala]|nr:hypothetical protein B0H13DRAFT_1852122 [Mycena leptocephala]
MNAAHPVRGPRPSVRLDGSTWREHPVHPVRGPVCASTGRHGDDSRSTQCPRPRPCEFSSPPNASSHMSFSSDFDSSSGRAQETASPESGHTPCNAEGRSICIKAEKIVGDQGPKGMRDSKLAGQPSSSVVDPLCHVDIGEPRPEVWTYF